MGRGSAPERAPVATGAPPRFDPFAHVPDLAGKHALREDMPERGDCAGWTEEDIRDELRRYQVVEADEIALRNAGSEMRARSKPTDTYQGHRLPLGPEHAISRLGTQLRQLTRGARLEDSKQRALVLGSDGWTSLDDILGNAALPDALRLADLEYYGKSGARVDVDIRVYADRRPVETLAEIRAVAARLVDLNIDAIFTHSGKRAPYSRQDIRIPTRLLAAAVVTASTRAEAPRG